MMPPTITGPRSWCTCASSPRFTIDAAGLYSVELADTPPLMARTTGRCRSNYFFGGDVDGQFATGRVWQIPAHVWRHLSRAGSLYYRVVAVDLRTGTPVPSVVDGRLDTLPSIDVRPCLLVGVPAWSRPVREATVIIPSAHGRGPATGSPRVTI